MQQRINTVLLVVIVAVMAVWIIFQSLMPRTLLVSPYFYLGLVLSAMMFIFPLWVAELALVGRSQTSPIQGFIKLTRESDSAQWWRMISWLVLGVVTWFVAIFLQHAAEHITATLASSILVTKLPIPYMLGLLVLFIFALSWLRWLNLYVALAIVSVALMVSLITPVFLPNNHIPMNTQVDMLLQGACIGMVAAFAGFRLICIPHFAKILQAAWLYTIIAATVLGGIVWIFAMLALPLLSSLLLSCATVLLSALLLFISRVWLSDADFSRVKASAIQLLLLGLWLWLQSMSWVQEGFIMLIAQSTIVIFIAIYVGWQMKISHLRKTIGFTSEWRYNIFRVWIRLVVPLGYALMIAYLVGQY